MPLQKPKIITHFSCLNVWGILRVLSGWSHSQAISQRISKAITQMFRRFGRYRMVQDGTGGSLTVSDFIHFHWRCFSQVNISTNRMLVIGSRSSQAMWVTWKKSKVLRSSWWPKNWRSRWWWMSETQVMAGMPETKHEEFGCWEKNDTCVWSRCIAHVISTGVTGSLR